MDAYEEVFSSVLIASFLTEDSATGDSIVWVSSTGAFATGGSTSVCFSIGSSATGGFDDTRPIFLGVSKGASATGGFEDTCSIFLGISFFIGFSFKIGTFLTAGAETFFPAYSAIHAFAALLATLLAPTLLLTMSWLNPVLNVVSSKKEVSSSSFFNSSRLVNFLFSQFLKMT